VEKRREIEHEGSIWKHPYLVYVALTVVIAVFLGTLGYLAWQNDWIPSRGNLGGEAR
jgi:hypothetical protein